MAATSMDREMTACEREGCVGIKTCRWVIPEERAIQMGEVAGVDGRIIKIR